MNLLMAARRWALRRQPGESTRPRERSPAQRLGFRRIELVRIVIDDGAIRAYVIGTTHRLSRAVPVPWALATEIVATGVPVRTIDRRR